MTLPIRTPAELLECLTDWAWAWSVDTCEDVLILADDSPQACPEWTQESEDAVIGSVGKLLSAGGRLLDLLERANLTDDYAADVDETDTRRKALEAEVARLTTELDEERARRIVHQNARALSLLGRSSEQEARENGLREKLAIAELEVERLTTENQRLTQRWREALSVLCEDERAIHGEDLADAIDCYKHEIRALQQALKVEREESKAEVQRLTEALREAGSVLQDYDFHGGDIPECPACGGREDEGGHTSECRWMKVLAALKGSASKES
jgi:hypothetical protein